MKRVNLRDVAARAGVSVSTVSMALRGKVTVRATTERVRALAEEMGYRPNPILASLASKRFRSPSAVNGVPLAIYRFPYVLKEPEERPSYHVDLMAEARILGYAPRVYDLTNASNPKTLFRDLHHRMVQGIVITGSMDEHFAAEFDWEPFSVVQCGRFQTVHSFHTVRPNIFQAVKLAFTQLRLGGYSRIGFAMGQHDQPLEDDEARYGAAIALEGKYLPRKDRLPVYTGPIHDREAFLQWYDRWKPAAVVGFTNLYYWYLKDHGVQIPKQVSFVGLHADRGEDGLYSGLYQNFPKISQQAILLLDQMIRNHECGRAADPLHILVPSTWDDGKSFKRIKK